MFKKAKLQISMIFSLITTTLLVILTFSILLTLKFFITEQVKENLSVSINKITNNESEGINEEKAIIFQRNYINEGTEANVYDIVTKEEDLENIQENQSVYSQLLYNDGTVIVSSDLFENIQIDPQKTGFFKIEEDNVCVYVLAEKYTDINDEELIARVAEFCPISTQKERSIALGFIGIDLIFSIFIFFISLLFADIFLKPIKSSYEISQANLRNIYHELLTPVTIAISDVEKAILKQKYKEGIEEIKKDLNEIYMIIEYLKSSVNDTKKEIIISEIIKTVIKSFENNKEDNKNIFNLQIHNEIKVKVEKEALYIIIKNLLENSLKYTKEGSTINVIIENKSFKIINFIEESLVVDINKLTEKYYRGENNKKEGIGIGLSIVKDICKNKGWRFNIEISNNKFIAKVTLK